MYKLNVVFKWPKHIIFCVCKATMRCHCHENPKINKQKALIAKENGQTYPHALYLCEHKS